MANDDNASGSAATSTKPQDPYRHREVNQQLATIFVQGAIAVAAVVAVLFAARAADSASKAVSAQKQGNEQKAVEDRLGTAIDAMGGDNAAQRVAGLTLLRRLATESIANAKASDASGSAHDALSLYRGTVDVLATFLKAPIPPPATFGFDDPNLGPDFAYASADMRYWLDNEKTFKHLAKGNTAEPQFAYAATDMRYWLKNEKTFKQPAKGNTAEPLPRVDLTKAELFRVSWGGVDFSWLQSRNLPEADLRKAFLAGSRWGESNLRNAHLGCAHLDDAQFERSTFSGADLRFTVLKTARLAGATFTEGANLTGADLTGAHVEGAHFESTTTDRGRTRASADLTGADLTSAHLNGANLAGANLAGATLNHADLTGANLTGAVLANVTVDGQTKIDPAALQAGQQLQPPESAQMQTDPACTEVPD